MVHSKATFDRLNVCIYLPQPTNSCTVHCKLAGNGHSNRVCAFVFNLAQLNSDLLSVISLQSPSFFLSSLFMKYIYNTPGYTQIFCSNLNIFNLYRCVFSSIHTTKENFHIIASFHSLCLQSRCL